VSRFGKGLVGGGAAVKVPVVLLQGDQDPQTPVQTVRELMAISRT
jgi:hypothetical protein